VLSATTSEPADASYYEPVGDSQVGVRYRRAVSRAAVSVTPAPAPWDRSVAASPLDHAPVVLQGQGRAEPEELLLEMRGRRRPRLTACWDGCAFKI
jgi:hypothetical protein